MNFIADFYQLGLTDVYNHGKTVKPYLAKNYIKTNLVGILVKNEANVNKVHDLEVYFEVYNQQL